MDEGAIAALFTGLFAIIVAIIALIQARDGQAAARLAADQADKAAVALEGVKADLARRGADDQARRDYEYGARTRLYAVVEPLLFQVDESARVAAAEIDRLWNDDHQQRLAMSADSRTALASGGFIGSTSYDCTFAAYALLRPLGSYRLIQRQLTSVDLGVDPRIRAQWILLHSAYRVTGHDHQLAALGRALAYEPRVSDWRTARQADPAQHWWQGLTQGRLDNAIDAIIDEDRTPPGLITFDRFEELFRTASEDPGSSLDKALGTFANPLFDFTPATRPVFCRIVIVQATLYRTMPLLDTLDRADLRLQDVRGLLHTARDSALAAVPDVVRRGCEEAVTAYLDHEVAERLV